LNQSRARIDAASSTVLNESQWILIVDLKDFEVIYLLENLFLINRIWDIAASCESDGLVSDLRVRTYISRIFLSS